MSKARLKRSITSSSYEFLLPSRVAFSTDFQINGVARPWLVTRYRQMVCLLVCVELCPVQRHDEFLPYPDDELDPELEQARRRDAGVAQQPVDLLGSVLRVDPLRRSQTAADRVNGEACRVQNAAHSVGEGVDAPRAWCRRTSRRRSGERSSASGGAGTAAPVLGFRHGGRASCPLNFSPPAEIPELLTSPSETRGSIRGNRN